MVSTSTSRYQHRSVTLNQLSAMWLAKTWIQTTECTRPTQQQSTITHSFRPAAMQESTLTLKSFDTSHKPPHPNQDIRNAREAHGPSQAPSIEFQCPFESQMKTRDQQMKSGDGVGSHLPIRQILSKIRLWRAQALSGGSGHAVTPHAKPAPDTPVGPIVLTLIGSA